MEVFSNQAVETLQMLFKIQIPWFLPHSPIQKLQWFLELLSSLCNWDAAVCCRSVNKYLGILATDNMKIFIKEFAISSEITRHGYK